MPKQTAFLLGFLDMLRYFLRAQAIYGQTNTPLFILRNLSERREQDTLFQVWTLPPCVFKIAHYRLNEYASPTHLGTHSANHRVSHCLDVTRVDIYTETRITINQYCRVSNLHPVNRSTNGKMTRLVGLNMGGIMSPPASPFICHASTARSDFRPVKHEGREQETHRKPVQRQSPKSRPISSRRFLQPSSRSLSSTISPG